MKLKLLSSIIVSFCILQCNCMEQSVFQELDEYRSNPESMDATVICPAYNKAVSIVQEQIATFKKRLAKITDKHTLNEEEKENGCLSPEGVRSNIRLLEERLFDLSSDGELGMKIKQCDCCTSVEVKTFSELQQNDQQD